MPHGLQRALGIVVSLAAEPKLPPLDEPFADMNPEEARVMMEHIRDVRWRSWAAHRRLQAWRAMQ